MGKKTRFDLRKVSTIVLVLLFVIVGCSETVKAIDSRFVIETITKYGYKLEDVTKEQNIDLDELFGCKILDYHLLNSGDISIGAITTENPQSAINIYNDIKSDRKQNYESEDLQGVESDSDASNKYVLDMEDFYISVIRKDRMVIFIMAMPPHVENAKKIFEEIDTYR